jgi:hypothetical protein
MAIRVFLSYSSKDKVLAGKIDEQLKKFGANPYLANDDIKPTEQWQKRIETELKKCDVFIPILTSKFHYSKWTDQEIGFALCRDILIVPLKVDTNPYGFMGKFQALPLMPRDIEQTCIHIAKVVCEKTDFADKVLKGVIKIFGASDSFVEAEQNSSYLLKFQAFLTPKHIRAIRRLAASNQQVVHSFGAQRNLHELT